MAELRKSRKKLKIVLCCVLGVIVAVGVAIFIWWLCSALGTTPEVEIDETQNYKSEVEEGARYSEDSQTEEIDGVELLGRLAYVLDQQESYHSEANTVSNVLIATQYTNSFKDYKDGIMVSSDITYGYKNAGTQSCFVLDGDGAGVYMRTASGTMSSSSTGTNVTWNEGEPVYYLHDDYLYIYGQYSTEMTVYVLNYETVKSWNEVVNNGDGTYTQTYYLDAAKAAYFYQYAMQTRGGLDRLPEFESITLTVTFDDNYRVLTIVAEETSDITYIFTMGSTATTTTTYSYDNDSFDSVHYGYYESYYKNYVGTFGSTTGGDEDELDALSLVVSAFAGVISGEGQQFDGVLTLGENTYYGRLYVNVDLENISDDVLGSLDIRITLSADENIDEQDLYLELNEGSVNCYYSSDFALTFNINDISEIVSSFKEWAASFATSAATYSSEDSSSTLEELLAQLLAGLTVEETEDGAVVYLTLDDVYGIAIAATFNFTAAEGEDGTDYTFTGASLENISYEGSEIAASLTLTPSTAATISHDPAESPFDIITAADALLKLLKSENFAVGLTLDGGALADVLAQLGVSEDIGDLLAELNLELSGVVNVNDLTANVSVVLTSVSSGTLLSADIYYDYAAGTYGTVYLAIDTLLGEENVDLKLSCDIGEIIDAVSTILSAVQGSGTATLADTQSDEVVSIISAILSFDLGSIVSDLTANSSLISATVNLDSLLAGLGVDLSLGEISLEYAISGGVGSLSGSIDGLLTVSIEKSETGVTAPDLSGYVDIGFIADFIESGATTDDEGNTSFMYTFYQEELSLSLLGMANVDIEDLYVTVGVDEEGEFVLSLTGELQASYFLSMLPLTTTKTIGFTYYNDYITLMSHVDGEDAEYRVMTTDYLLDNLLAFDDSLESLYAGNILTWYLGMDTYSTWPLILAFAASQLPDLSSGLLDAEDIYLYDIVSNVSDDSDVTDEEVTSSLLASYLLGLIFNVGDTEMSYGDMSTALANLGLTDSEDTYYALSLNASAISSMFEELYIAIIGDSETGIGGIKAYLSVGGMISTLIDLTYSTENTAVTNYYKEAVETFGIDFDYDFSDVELGDHYYAIFGEFNSAEYDETIEGSGYNYSTVLEYYEVTMSIYDGIGGELISEQAVQYSATVYLYDPENLIIEDGVEYIYVVLGEDGKVVYDENDMPVQSIDVTGDMVVCKVLASDYLETSISD